MLIRLSASLALVLVGFAADPVAGYAQGVPPATTDADVRRLTEQSQKLVGEAEQLFGQRKYADAVRKLDAAAEIADRLDPHLKDRWCRVQIAGGRVASAGMYGAVGRLDKALAVARRAEAMYDALLTDKLIDPLDVHRRNCLDLLGQLLMKAGELEKALPYCQQVAKLAEKSYEKGRKIARRDYPDWLLADHLGTLAHVLLAMDRPKEAIPHIERADKIYTQLYDDAKAREARFGKDRAQDEFINELTNPGNSLAANKTLWGMALDASGRADEARTQYRSALDLFKEVFPKGHPSVATAQMNLARFDARHGDREAALKALKEARKLQEELYPARLFPEGHPHQASCDSDIGELLLGSGKADEAMPYLRRAFACNLGHLRRYSSAQSEGEALAYLRILPASRDLLLTALTSVTDSDGAAYDAVWQSKALSMRILRSRHLAASVARLEDEKVKADWEKLLAVRRAISRLLVTPSDPQDREQLLAKLTATREEYEKSLAARLGKRSIELEDESAQSSFKDLAGALPADAVFIDFIAYDGTTAPGKPARQYAAFAVLPGKPVKRINLGAADKIDEAIRAWRTAIAAGEDGAAAGAVSRLVWEKVSPCLSKTARTLYLSPDGDLALVPWAALPGSQPGGVLLEDFAGGIGIVPHGPFLLEQLRCPPPVGKKDEAVLAVGGVHYGAPGTGKSGRFWKELKGTKAEVRQARELAGTRKVTVLSGDEATTANVISKLCSDHPTYALFATHGQFDEQALGAERKRAASALRVAEVTIERLALPPVTGQRSPLAYTSLVFAHANNPGADSLDGGYLSGESICGLPLEGMKLAVLSACETGLGSQFDSGEGVYGLQRAFHVAGCSNVVASLWRVDDSATTALMAKLCHEIWQNGKPPLAALREAQLTVRSHPELIAEFAKERGPIDLNKAVTVAPAAKPVARGGTETKLWAAFTLSGAGR